PRSPGTGDSEHRHPFLFRVSLRQSSQDIDAFRKLSVRRPLRQGDQPGDGAPVSYAEAVRFPADLTDGGEIGLPQHPVDHALKPHLPPVLRREDLGHPVFLQLPDFPGNDDTAPSAEDLDVAGPPLRQQVDHIFEKLHVPPLVGGDGDSLDIFLDGRFRDFVDGTVVTQVNHLGARCLKQAPKQVDRCVVPVEQAGGGDEAHRVLRSINVRLHTPSPPLSNLSPCIAFQSVGGGGTGPVTPRYPRTARRTNRAAEAPSAGACTPPNCSVGPKPSGGTSTSGPSP